VDKKIDEGTLTKHEVAQATSADCWQLEYYGGTIQDKYGLNEPYDVNNCFYCVAAALFDTGGYISDEELYQIVKTRKVVKNNNDSTGKKKGA
jgi:hypothetical protein